MKRFITDIWDSIVGIFRESGALAVAIIVYASAVTFFAMKDIVPAVIAMAIVAVVLIIDSDW